LGGLRLSDMASATYHISRSHQASLIVVDEPELYLHPDVQRQLLGILRDAGPDVVLATHSTEIMSEADPSEIILIDKTKRSADRLRDVEEVQAALDAIGSVQNITLTRLAKNRRLLLVEGDSDFRLVRRFARKLGFTELAAGTDLTSLESGGFRLGNGSAPSLPGSKMLSDLSCMSERSLIEIIAVKSKYGKSKQS
jgi:predicted ATP-dependent endonuclease of OLD family